MTDVELAKALTCSTSTEKASLAARSIFVAVARAVELCQDPGKADIYVSRGDAPPGRPKGQTAPVSSRATSRVGGGLEWARSVAMVGARGVGPTLYG